MSPRRKKRLLLVSLLLFGFGTTISLVLYALNQNMDLFYTATEIVHGKSDGSKPKNEGKMLYKHTFLGKTIKIFAASAKKVINPPL